MEVISVRAPSKAHAQRLIAALHPRVSASLDGDDTTVDVALLLDAEAATRLIDLFDVLGAMAERRRTRRCAGRLWRTDVHTVLAE